MTMASYVEHLAPAGRLEVAYRIYEAELKRLLRRYHNVLRSPFRCGDLSMGSNYGLRSVVVEIESVGNCPMAHGIGGCRKGMSRGCIKNAACALA
jgi:hypothetical protein